MVPLYRHRIFALAAIPADRYGKTSVIAEGLLIFCQSPIMLQCPLSLGTLLLLAVRKLFIFPPHSNGMFPPMFCPDLWDKVSREPFCHPAESTISIPADVSQNGDLVCLSYPRSSLLCVPVLVVGFA